MSYRKNLIVAVFSGVAVLASAVVTPSSVPAQADRGTGLVVLPFCAVDQEMAIVRGQDESAARRRPSLADQIKRTWNKVLRDGDDDSSPGGPAAHNRDTLRDSTPRPQPIPMTPPKPPTAQELQHAIENPDAPIDRRQQPPASTTPSVARVAEQPHGTVRENHTEVSRTPQASSPSGEKSTLVRLKDLRENFFDPLPIEDVLPPTPSPLPKTPPMNSQMNSGRVDIPPKRPPALADPSPSQNHPMSPTVPVHSPNEVGVRPTFAVPPTIAMGNQSTGDVWGSDTVETPLMTRDGGLSTKEIGGINVPPKTSSPWNRTGKTVETSDSSSASPIDMVVPGQPQRNSTTLAVEREKISSPLIELEIIGSPKANVGQESAYEIRVFNRGGAPAEQVVLTIEIPNWIDVSQPDRLSAGTTSITPRPNSDIREFVWKIAKVDAKTEERIVLNLIPRQQETVDLKIRYDFRKPLASVTIAVQEPVLEMELQGPDEVLWESEVIYKLFVRNTGNGEAENIKLELLQAGTKMETDLPLLGAGEEQSIDIRVQTGKQDHVDIHIQATGPYDLSAKVLKRITVMRPELNIEVDLPEMLFVGNPAEYSVRVKNIGGATAKNVELAASIPLGTKHVSNTAGGRLTPQNQVLWNIDAIPSGGEFVAAIVCEMRREGPCRLEVAAHDRSGLLASGSGSVNVQAIADLKMHIESPQGPVEIGQEAVFVIHVTNRGTKTAEDVEVIAAFARGLEPHAIEGANGTMLDGQVTFDKIPAISAGQTVTLKVKGRADRPGNLRMRAEVICQGVNAHLVYEQATFFFQKQKNRASSIADSPGTAGISGFDQPSTPQSIQKSTTSLPLENVPAAAERATLAPLR